MKRKELDGLVASDVDLRDSWLGFHLTPELSSHLLVKLPSLSDFKVLSSKWSFDTTWPLNSITFLFSKSLSLNAWMQHLERKIFSALRSRVPWRSSRMPWDNLVDASLNSPLRISFSSYRLANPLESNSTCQINLLSALMRHRSTIITL